jgi:hypothetical protein
LFFLRIYGFGHILQDNAPETRITASGILIGFIGIPTTINRKKGHGYGFPGSGLRSLESAAVLE